MTYQIPRKTFADKILALFGKSRGVYVPGGIKTLEFPHGIRLLRKESFWTALMRPVGSQLPDGVVAYEDIESIRSHE